MVGADCDALMSGRVEYDMEHGIDDLIDPASCCGIRLGRTSANASMERDLLAPPKLCPGSVAVAGRGGWVVIVLNVEVEVAWCLALVPPEVRPDGSKAVAGRGGWVPVPPEVRPGSKAVAGRGGWVVIVLNAEVEVAWCLAPVSPEVRPGSKAVSVAGRGGWAMHAALSSRSLELHRAGRGGWMPEVEVAIALCVAYRGALSVVLSSGAAAELLAPPLLELLAGTGAVHEGAASLVGRGAVDGRSDSRYDSGGANDDAGREGSVAAVGASEIGPQWMGLYAVGLPHGFSCPVGDPHGRGGGEGIDSSTISNVSSCFWRGIGADGGRVGREPAPC